MVSTMYAGISDNNNANIQVLYATVRFGKYTGLRTADKKVHLVINGESHILCTSRVCCTHNVDSNTDKAALSNSLC